eukprot:gene1500-12117_t
MENKTVCIQQNEMENKKSYKDTQEYPGFDIPKKYKVNLNLSPRERWSQVIKDHLEPLKKLTTTVHSAQEREFGSSSFSQTCLSILNNIQNTQQTLIEEMKGIAEITEKEAGLTFEDILSLNIGYDLLARCTSGNVEDPINFKGVFHFRNMDWDMEALRPLTIDVEYVKNDQVVFTTTTWVCFVGVLTGMTNNTKNGWSISLNFRWCDSSAIWNYFSFLFQHEPIEFIIRNALEKNLSFDEAVKYLKKTKIIAPCYLVISGCNKGEGILITRNRSDEVKPLELKNSQSNYVLMTNVDHWVDKVTKKWACGDDLLLNSVERRICASQGISNIKFEKDQKIEDVESILFSVLEKNPVYNYQTVYQVVMSPKNALYSSRVVKPTKEIMEHFKEVYQ